MERGEYNRRQIWNRLGRYPREAMIRFKMSDKVESEIVKLEGDFSG